MMDAISEILTPYHAEIEFVAVVVTSAQMFSGAFIIKDIYNKKTTKGSSPAPFVGGLLMGVLMLKYGLLLNDAAMLKVNVIGLFLNVLYLVAYSCYVDHSSEILKPFIKAAIFAVVVWLYTLYEHPDLIVHRYGVLITGLMLTLIAAPLFDLGSIIKNRTAHELPMPIILSGTLVTFLWLLHGFVMKNEFMILQNVVAFTLCMVQVLLYIFFRGGVDDKTKKKAN